MSGLHCPPTFYLPGRLSRPKRILVILRGLPGSGKSHVARVIRETEAEHGGEAPRILSLDEYFVTVRVGLDVEG
jgi:YLP motif-containing protein 1